MGYVHQFTCQPGSLEYAAMWPQLLADTARIVQALDRMKITVCGPDGTGRPVISATEGILFGGSAAAGQHEGPLRLPPPGPVEPGAAADTRLWRYTKTDHEPYDLAVTTVMLRCRVLAPDTFQIGSDGRWDPDWIRPLGACPRDLNLDLFGRTIDGDPLVDPSEGMAIGHGGWMDLRLVRDPVLRQLFETIEGRQAGQ